MRLLGDHYLKEGNLRLAIECYERSLKSEPNDGFSLSGLALSHFATGNREKAAVYAGRLEQVWSQADPGLKWLEDVRALKLGASPTSETPRPERIYRPRDLDPIGPMNWEPFKAPNLQVVDRQGKLVRLSDMKGKNVVLVFFLGAACTHCVGHQRPGGRIWCRRYGCTGSLQRDSGGVEEGDRVGPNKCEVPFG